MEIELSEDLQHYKESIAMGLNVKQLIYSVLSNRSRSRNGIAAL